MSSILENIEDSSTGYHKRIIIKGASEIVLGTCSHYMNRDGEIVELTEDK